MFLLLSKYGEKFDLAIQRDLHRHPQISTIAETGLAAVCRCDYVAENLQRWVRDEEFSPEVWLQPMSCKIRREPKGVVLGLGAWNFPVGLPLLRLFGWGHWSNVFSVCLVH